MLFSAGHAADIKPQHGANGDKEDTQHRKKDGRTVAPASGGDEARAGLGAKVHGGGVTGVQGEFVAHGSSRIVTLGDGNAEIVIALGNVLKTDGVAGIQGGAGEVDTAQLVSDADLAIGEGQLAGFRHGVAVGVIEEEDADGAIAPDGRGGWGDRHSGGGCGGVLLADADEELLAGTDGHAVISLQVVEFAQLLLGNAVLEGDADAGVVFINGVEDAPIHAGGGGVIKGLGIGGLGAGGKDESAK